jgi:hypothetical protein
MSYRRCPLIRRTPTRCSSIYTLVSAGTCSYALSTSCSIICQSSILPSSQNRGEGICCINCDNVNHSLRMKGLLLVLYFSRKPLWWSGIGQRTLAHSAMR